MRKILARSWMCLLVLLTDCITPFVPPVTTTYPRLVVDGLITDQPGPYKVKLMTTANTSNTIYSNVYPYNAHVFIRDDLGNEEQLKEIRYGNFETSPTGIRGVVGRSYHLIIILEGGVRYESIPEKLKAVSPVESINTIYTELPLGSPTIGKFGAYVETQDSGESGNYYKWTWAHYEARTYCASGMGPYGSPVPTKSLCCEPCWSIDLCESCINVFSDRLINGRKISQFLMDIPYDDRSPYYLMVQQYSLSQEAYKFWSVLNSQINVAGSVFDAPPATIPGNFFNVSNKGEQVLGFFGASAVSKKIIYIERDKVDKPPIAPAGEFTLARDCFPCQEGYFRTRSKPEGWVE